MKEFHIYFCDFWEDFRRDENVFVGALRQSGNVIVDDIVTKDTQLVICSCFGYEHFSYIGKKRILYYSGENDFPTFLDYDYAVTHSDFAFDRHMRMPLWVSYNYDRTMKGGISITEVPQYDRKVLDRKFCADVISNTNVAWKNRFALSEQLSANYKPLDHGGGYLNNVGGPVADKIEFLKGYKFSIASENSMVDGYVTEKIYDSFIAGTVPIYLGSRTVTDDFNPDAFVNVADFKRFSDLIAKVREIDENDELYMSMLNEPKLRTEGLYDDFVDRLGKFIEGIIENGSIRCHRYGRMGLYLERFEMFLKNS